MRWGMLRINKGSAVCVTCQNLVLMLAAQLRTGRMRQDAQALRIFIVAVAQLAARRSHNPKVVSSIRTCHRGVEVE